MNSKISYAVAAILGGASCAAIPAARAADTNAAEAGSEGLVEVTVTAQRRTENMQDVPISMQALTQQTLQQLNVSTLDDYLKYLPNVTTANNGPGQNEIFMRGLSAGSQPSQGSASTGLWPNVAIYLDNQSGQLPNRNLDIYAADLNRIEVLDGPQGTLYGAGAEAGVIRYITNEPKLDVVEGNITAGYGTTAHGDPNTNVTAVLNLPLIAEHLAVRGVVYDDRRGGYIDNVPATFKRKNTDVGIHYAQFPAVNGQCPDGLPNSGFCVPPGSPSINNAFVTGRAINPVTYQGFTGGGPVQVQRQLGRADHPVVPEHGLARGVLPAAERLGRRAAAAAARSRCSTPPSTRTSSRAPPGRSTARSGTSRRSTPAATWCATSTRWATTPTTPVASMPTTTSASGRAAATTTT